MTSAELKQRCKIQEVERSAVEPLIRAHYLHKWPGVVVKIYGLLDRQFIVGVCVYALPPRETCKRYGGWVWELARLWIEDDMPKNSETFFIAATVRRIVKEHPELTALVSYADPSVGHKGTIYKAANWTEDGRTDQERKTPRFDYAVNGKIYSRRSHVPEGALVTRVPRTSKYRFVYWLRNRKEMLRDTR